MPRPWTSTGSTLDRAEAPAGAGFDPSREATLTRRYEAAASRELYRSMKELREVEAEARAAAEGADRPDGGPRRAGALGFVPRTGRTRAGPGRCPRPPYKAPDSPGSAPEPGFEASPGLRTTDRGPA